ncbi:MAG TPA: MSMEG_4193 family putative phosphomutase [Ornithinimicrobium sp.]|uniref:MSMEG_4193 family putative phosphomutase n=1 Tax=Ornithinimicrobium sp. TaxID=1977084 RepID=UPI002B470F65|nr:MSMEG_4193 family putative phosphomutase [Ornithinimicrobium sp.]HKJ12521.1 MSMEG_4193 family putative phosphomutase [Ornithinimicrobium sp.]
MAIMLLVRHGRTRANAQGILAGWTAGIGLDEHGQRQVERVATRLAGTPVATVMSSPLQRCQETALALVQSQESPPSLRTVEDLGECRYGGWTGRPLKELATEPLWKDVQTRPSRVRFPDSADFAGESMPQMQQRAVSAVRTIDAEVSERHGPGAIWVAVSHGDVIKAVLADAAGISLDHFQRLLVDPASVSIVRYAREQTFLVRTNDSGSDPVDLTALAAAAAASDADHAEVGGGAGTV